MKVYRSIGKREFCRLMFGIPITGCWNASRFHSECSYNGYFGGVVCAFLEPIQWLDSDHVVVLELDIPEENIVDAGMGTWMMPKSFEKSKIYRGRAGNVPYDIPEVFFKEYDIRNVSRIIHMPSQKWVLSELFREWYWRCPHYDKPMTDDEIRFELSGYMNYFPEENTAIPRKDYKLAFGRMVEQIMSFSV